MRTAAHLTIAALGAGALLLAGCSSSDGGATPSAAPTVTVTQTRTVTATPSPSASANATATAATSTACTTKALRATVVDGDAGAGQRRAILVVTNTSGTKCTLNGYPGLQLISTTGSKIPTTTTRVADPAPRTVKVAPDGTASVTLTWGVVASDSEPTDGPCEKDPSQLKVIPPGQTSALTTAWTLGPVCNKGRIATTAFVAGSGG